MDRPKEQGIPLAGEIGDQLVIIYDALSALGMIDHDDDDAASLPQVPVTDMLAKVARD